LRSNEAAIRAPILLPAVGCQLACGSRVRPDRSAQNRRFRGHHFYGPYSAIPDLWKLPVSVLWGTLGGDDSADPRMMIRKSGTKKLESLLCKLPMLN
jgi:hypothetical protein